MYDPNADFHLVKTVYGEEVVICQECNEQGFDENNPPPAQKSWQLNKKDINV